MKKISQVFIVILCSFFAISVPAQNWEEIKSMEGGNIFAFAVNENKIFVGAEGGVFLSTNNGTSWTGVNNGLTRTVCALAIKGDTIFAGTGYGGVFLSTNNGADWSEINNGLMRKTILSLATGGNMVFAGTDTGGVFLSTDNGTSWASVNNGLPKNAVHALAISGNYVFAGTLGGVFLSTNNGTSWTSVSNGLTEVRIYSLALSGNAIVAGNWNGVSFSTNNGTSWTNYDLNKSTLSLAIKNNTIFAGTWYGGVFLSKDNGASWMEVNSGLTNLGVFAIGISGDYIFAGTQDRHLFRMDISNVSIDHLAESPHKELMFGVTSQQGTMTIEYVLPSISNAQLNLYTISGKLVLPVTKQIQSAGKYSVTLSKGTLTTGIYVVGLKAGMHKENKTILITK